METIGFVGVGKIGMPISQNLIKSGYRVVGYRRSSLAEFEKIGGIPARSAAEVGALGLKAGVDVPLMIKAIATGSGGSTQFGIRAPWMAERRFKPPQGTIPGLQHYIEMIGEFADSVGVATPLLDRTAELFQQFVAMGLSDCDGTAMIDVIGSLERPPHHDSKTRSKARRPTG